MMTNNYNKLDGLGDIYLEDSYVLGIVECEDNLLFEVDFVLTEAHPLYSPPESGEQYCYKKGSLRFNGCKSINWQEKSSMFFTDKSGEEDLGNIDVFIKTGPSIFLSGDWGSVSLEGGNVDVIYNP